MSDFINPVWPGDPEPTSDLSLLRLAFNELRYYERALAGELAIRTVRDRHPRRPPGDHPHCTRSQFVEFSDAGQLVASAHQYVRPDGTISGSGRPDPRMVVTAGGTILKYVPERQLRSQRP